LGYCGKHYDKFKKYGDPLFVKRVRNRCTADGCDNYVKSDGLCSKHHSRLLRFGTLELTKPWRNLPPELKWCTGHQAALSVEEFGGKNSMCRSCYAAYRRRRREEKPDPLVPKAAKTCAECGAEFLGDKRQTLHCSPACKKAGKRRADLEYQAMYPDRHSEANRKWRQRYPDKVREKARVYRARKMNATVEPVSEGAIFQRDQWTCGICGQIIDPARKYPDPMSPSIDHIVPLFRGGAHSPANCQASHLRCNVRKGASLTPS